MICVVLALYAFLLVGMHSSVELRTQNCNNQTTGNVITNTEKKLTYVQNKFVQEQASSSVISSRVFLITVRIMISQKVTGRRKLVGFLNIRDSLALRKQISTTL